MFSRQSTCFCVVIVQCVCFLVCRCRRRYELNSRRRVKRFKRRLRLRLSVCAARWLALVFAPLVERQNAVRRVRRRLHRCICTRARFLIYARGSRVLWLPRWGGVSLPRPILKRVYSKTLVIQAAGAELGGRGGANGGKKSPKNFLRKTLDIGSNWVYTGCRKRRKSLPHELGVNINLVLCIVNTMYIESVAYVFGGEQCSFFICGSKHTTP